MTPNSRREMAGRRGELADWPGCGVVQTACFDRSRADLTVAGVFCLTVEP